MDSELLPPGKWLLHFLHNGHFLRHFLLAIDDAVADGLLMLHGNGYGVLQGAQGMEEHSAADFCYALGVIGSQGVDGVRSQMLNNLRWQHDGYGVRHIDYFVMDVCRCAVAYFNEDGTGAPARGEEGQKTHEQEKYRPAD